MSLHVVNEKPVHSMVLCLCDDVIHTIHLVVIKSLREKSTSAVGLSSTETTQRENSV